MEAVQGATAFQWLVGIAGFGLLFILNTLRADIKKAQTAAELAAAEAKKDLLVAKTEIMTELEQTVTEATASVRAVADEGKRLGIQALDRLNQHELHVARNHPTNAAIDKLEAQIANVGHSISAEIRALSVKLDGKQDKSGGNA